MPDPHPTASDFADAEAQAERAKAFAETVANEDGPAPIERPTPADGAMDAKETQARHKLREPRFMLGDETIDWWLEKHGAIAILGALAAMDRKEQGGTVVEHPVSYLEAILTSKSKSHRKGRSHDEPSVTKPARPSEQAERLARMRQGYAEAFSRYQGHRQTRKDKNRPAFRRYHNATEYAEACLHAHRLAHEIAALDDCPERDELIARYRQLP